MATARIEEFTVRDNKIARYAKALGHPARIAIIRLLLKRQSCICSEIVEELPLSQSTVSQHLKELKEAGIIKGEIDGPRICYCIDSDEWSKVSSYLNELLHIKVESSSSCC
jgi:DNA-binding transcriptional ArsR family regulator